MKKSFVLFSVIAAALLAGCSGDPTRSDEYKNANQIRFLDMPPDLTSPDKNLVMQFPEPSLKACMALFEANEKFKQVEKEQEEARRQGKEKVTGPAKSFGDPSLTD